VLYNTPPSMNYAWGRYFPFLARLYNVAFSIDGLRLLTVSRSGYVFIINSADGSFVTARMYTSYTNYVNDNTMRRILISSTNYGFAIISFTVSGSTSYDYIYKI